MVTDPFVKKSPDGEMISIPKWGGGLGESEPQLEHPDKRVHKKKLPSRRVEFRIISDLDFQGLRLAGAFLHRFGGGFQRVVNPFGVQSRDVAHDEAIKLKIHT